MRRLLVLFSIVLPLLFSSPVLAKNTSIYQVTVNQPLSLVYKNISKSFDDSRFYVVNELNIGQNISRFKDRWENFNQNQLTGFKSIVFCNGWFANKISNEDPSMLAFCPMHITLIEKDDKTSVLFVRPTFIAQHSPALNTFKAIEERVIAVIKAGVNH